ncbi:MAG TPA: tRNA (adenosine(37)-N6)-threonylcarbamoyltransferase complex ATPase subunit type 1 TsaE [Gemmatimonadales bacterium]
MAETTAVSRDLTLPELDQEAARLWPALPSGGVVWLSGDLASGKTTFVQALVRAAGGTDDARSPTFALVHRYDSPSGAIYHADCYRLRDPSEAIDLDLPALTRHARLVVVEWPERALAVLPGPDVHLRFSHVADPARRRVERIG